MFTANFHRLVLRALAMLLRLSLNKHPSAQEVDKLATEIETYAG